MIEIAITPSFHSKLKKIDQRLLEELNDAIEKLKDRKSHAALKLHKLRGPLRGRCAISVDYRHRIIFRWVTETRILLLDFGDHSVYE